MKTVVVGLGNVILGDEGVGIYVAEEIAKRIGTHESVKIVRTSWGGLNLLDIVYLEVLDQLFEFLLGFFGLGNRSLRFNQYNGLKRYFVFLGNFSSVLAQDNRLQGPVDNVKVGL